MPPFVIHANLDCEARWAGSALPAAIATRVSYYAALLAALAPLDHDCEVWAPAAIDPSRLLAAPQWPPPAMHVGTPPHVDLAWATDAKAVNDRRLAHEIAASIGASLPGARTITSPDELATVTGPWVCKAPWTTAGRDRCHGTGAPTTEQRTRLERLIERFGALVFEPWLDRVLDVGVCATVHPDQRVDVLAAHGLVTDARGTFLGVDLAAPALTLEEFVRLHEVTLAVGAALAERGYLGPFAIDAFVYREGEHRRLHPLCEINARYTFGWIARALQRRLGITRLGFSSPPEDATVLIAPADDGITAWIS